MRVEGRRGEEEAGRRQLVGLLVVGPEERGKRRLPRRRGSADSEGQGRRSTSTHPSKHPVSQLPSADSFGELDGSSDVEE